MTNAERCRLKYHKAVAEGRCTKCGEPSGRPVCARCSKYQSMAYSIRVKQCAAEHRCIKCGAQMPKSRKVQKCLSCTAIYSEYQRARRRRLANGHP